MWVRLLTRRHGVVRAFAFGASRSRRRFSGCLDLLNVLEVRAVLSRNGKFLNLEEGVLVQGPQRLRTDLARLGMAVNCVRFLEAMDVSSEEQDASPGYEGVSSSYESASTRHGAKISGPMDGAFELMRSLCVRLEAEQQTPDVLPALFRLRLASDQGFVPPFSHCSRCGRELVGQGGFFSVADGSVLCSGCTAAGAEERRHDARSHTAAGGLRVSAQALDALAAVQATPPEDWAPEQLEPSARRECARLVDSFVQYHLGLAWDRGRFRRG